MNTDHSIRPLLTGIHIFAGLSDEVMESLAASCRAVRAVRGEVVVREGEAAHEMFVIAGGRVEVVKHEKEPQEIRLAILAKGEFFGEMCILECMPRCATVRVIEDCELVCLRNGDLLRIFRNWPDQYAILILNVSRDLCRRLRRLHAMLCESSTVGNLLADNDVARIE